MKRIILIYNPNSSRYSEVKSEVLASARKLQGFIVGKYEVVPTNLDDNIAKLTKILRDDDLIIAAGGDATGIIAVNAIYKSEKDVTLAVLPYGNFNDLARTLGTKTLEDVFGLQTCSYYPLEIHVDGKFFRYATCYVTIGMTAEAVKLYDEAKMRKILKKSFGRYVGSYTNLASWYFKHRHKKQFIPKFKLNGHSMHPKTSDYAAVNGRSMARVMKGGEDYLNPKIFRSETDRLTCFWRLFKLMVKSILIRIPGDETTGDTLEFLKPGTVELQAEGESKIFNNINKIEIRKAKKCLKVVKI